MKITIESTINGAIITRKYDNSVPMQKTVYEFYPSDLKGLQNLLNDIKDDFEPGNKYDKERVYIEINGIKKILYLRDNVPYKLIDEGEING